MAHSKCSKRYDDDDEILSKNPSLSIFRNLLIYAVSQDLFW